MSTPTKVNSTLQQAGYWPGNLPRSLPRPATTLAWNLHASATRYPERTAVGFFGRDLSYRALLAQVEQFAGWLQKRAGIRRGDRVALFLQNSPQWLIAYHAVLRADAVVVPISPMSRAEDVAHYLRDSGAQVLVCAQDLADTATAGARAAELRHIVLARYGDYLPEAPELAGPEWLRAPPRSFDGTVSWQAVLDADERAGPPQAGPDDLCLMPYTSGSTGVPKACMHTHASFMHTVAGQVLWHGHGAATVFLGVLPMYHVSGLIQSVNCPILAGGCVVPLPRWDRESAMRLIAHYRISHVGIAPTAIIDLLSGDLARHDLSSVRKVAAGCATMPTEIWKRLHDTLGLPFIESYGMTETAATTHINPVERPKPQSVGIPFFDTETLIADPDTLRPLPDGEPGEILVRGPQMFAGYWGREQESAQAFAEVDGRSWYRSGDIGYRDAEGYYYITDRLKRMINASGLKIWPAEVEGKLYAHPAVQEACVIGTRDPYRGETAKALIVLRAASRGQVSEQDIIDWSREQMAAYKYPRVVEFVDSLPKSPVGKILWRELQERENARSAATPSPTKERS
jgi:fatty-acyl-CoA synthase